MMLCYQGSSAFFQVNNDTHFDNSADAREGDWGLRTSGTERGMYQFAWSFVTDTCTKNYVGKSMAFRIGGGTTEGTGYNYYDNFHVYTTAAPEPSTVALLVTGVLGMLAYAWRRKRRK